MSIFTTDTFINGTVDRDFLFGLMGNANRRFIGSNGNDFIVGDMSAFWCNPLGNISLATAFDIDLDSQWSTNSSPLVEDSSVPHTTIYAEGEGGVEYFTVTAGAGETITLDIDFANFDTFIELLDGSGAVLASNDNSLLTDGGEGSVSTADSYLEFTVASAGVYTIRVSEVDDGSAETDIEVGEDFLLNVSVTGHAATATQTSGSDEIFGGTGNDLLFGSDGNDKLFGGSGNDILHGGAGDDVLNSGDGSDIYRYGIGDGADIIAEDGFGDTDRLEISGYDFADATISQIRDSADLLIDFGGGDSIILRDGLFGNAFTTIEEIVFEDGTLLTPAMLRSMYAVEAATAGVDIITGTSQADSLTGGLGDDFLFGGDATDTYNYAAGDGADTVSDTGFGDADVLIIAGYDSTDASFTRIPFTNDLLIDFGGGDSVTIIGGMLNSGFTQVENITFDDLTITNLQLRQRVLDELVTAGDDVIVGTSGSETLTGGAGNDVLTGGDSSDTYIYNAGDEQDIINETGFGDTDTVTVNGYSSTDVTYRLNDTYPNDVILDFGGGDTLTIVNVLAGQTIESITFAGDAVTLTLAQLQTEATTNGIALPIVLGDGAANTIDSTAADEILRGLGGSDTYTYAAGDGNDIIDDNGFLNTDVLEIAGYDLADATFERVIGRNNDVRIEFSATDSIIIRNGLAGSNNDNIENITFTDLAETITSADVLATIITQEQTAGDDIIEGFFSNDTIDAGTGNDFISGGGGSDTYLFDIGDGQDTILDDGFLNADVLQFVSYSSTDATFSAGIVNRQDLIISFVNGDQVTVRNTLEDNNGDRVENIQFDGDAVSLTMADIRQILIDQSITSGDDVVIGRSVTSETFEAGLGDDYIEGRGGNDLYIFNVGDGNDTIFDNGFTSTDVLDFRGYSSTDATFSAGFENSYDLVITFAGGDSVTVLNTLNGDNGDQIEQYTFDGDAVTLTAADVRALVLATAVTSGNDRIIGTSFADTLDGGDGDDYLQGANGLDTLNGDAGDDLLDGGDADDILNGGDGDDVMIGGDEADTFNGGAGSDTVSYSYLNSSIQIDLLANTATGSDAFNDSFNSVENLIGSRQDDTLTGDANDNIIEGHDDGDTLDGGAGSDTASYRNSDAAVSIDLGTSTYSGGHAAGDTLANFENVIGSYFADTLTGDTGANSLIGLGGIDTLSGGDGDDVLDGGTGADILDGGNGNDTASYAGSKNGVSVNLDAGTAQFGDAHNDTLTSIENLIGSVLADALVGTSGVNSIVGGDGDDLIEGLAGADMLDGGNGNDTVSYNASNAAVDVNLDTNSTSGGHAVGDTISNFENAIGSAFNDLLTGNAGVNILSGGDGDDTLIGLDGGDTLNGGGGTDTASYSASSAGVTVDLGAGTASGGNAAGDILTDIENLTGSQFVDVLTGDAGANTLVGNDGNDTLIGGAGGDVLNGGNGTDTASYFASSGAVTVDLGAGTASGGDAAGDSFVSIENLIGSALADTLTGDAGVNNIQGGLGNDVIEGGDSADVLDGGAGTDTVSYAASSAGVTINLDANTASGGDAAGDIISNFENVTGSALNDLLLGDANVNVLSGGGGDDTLIGLAGGDTLNGGGGTDTASYSASSTGVSVDLGAGTASGGNAAGDTLTSIENLAGSQFADTLTGDAGANVLIGNDGNDVIEGGAGADTLNGGDDIDWLSYASASGAVTINLANNTANRGDALGDVISNFENILGSGFSDILKGDIAENEIDGGAGDDDIRSSGGDDIVDGGLGDDLIYGQSGNDMLSGGDGNDAVLGGNGDDVIAGELGNDTLSGQAGNDTINGGEGDDTLNGNAGDDVLNGGLGLDVINGGGGADIINGFDGDDVLNGATGEDTILGGNGNDMIFGNNQNDTLFGNGGTDMLNGGAGNDSLDGGGGNDTLIGSAGQDTLMGNLGNDNLSGDAGGDDLFGGDGNDTLNGGGGNDDLNGGAGADVFIANFGFKTDRIEDFEDGIDVIDFSGNSLANNIADVLAAAAQVGANVRIELNVNNVLILENFDLADLDASDFIF